MGGSGGRNCAGTSLGEGGAGTTPQYWVGPMVDQVLQSGDQGARAAPSPTGISHLAPPGVLKIVGFTWGVAWLMGVVGGVPERLCIRSRPLGGI